MELGLKDAAVLVTGGSSGIGRATAVAYGRTATHATAVAWDFFVR